MKCGYYECKISKAPAHLPTKRGLGLTLLVLVALVSLTACLDRRVSLKVYEVKHEERVNQFTVGIRRVFYRPKYDDSRPNAPNRGPDLVLIEGYLCNYASSPVRIYNLASEGEENRRLTTFSWGDEDDERATALFVGGHGSGVTQPNSQRLRQTTYREDASGAHYFEVPARQERQFTLRGSHSRLDSSDSDGTLELPRVESEDEGTQWAYRLEVPLPQSTSVKVFPNHEEEHYPVFANGDPEPQCSPRPDS